MFEFCVSKLKNKKMTFDSEQLIDELTKLTQNLISRVDKFQDLELEQLNFKPTENSWSILECMEHLNLYGKFYIPEIESSIEKTSSKANKTFKSGLLGNYFANSMKPKVQLNKMKTFKDKNPSGSQLDKSVLKELILQQEQLLISLSKAKNVDLNKIKTNITLPLLKFKLGDTFRFTIYHNERHVVQAEKVLTKISLS